VAELNDINGCNSTKFYSVKLRNIISQSEIRKSQKIQKTSLKLDRSMYSSANEKQSQIGLGRSLKKEA